MAETKDLSENMERILRRRQIIFELLSNFEPSSDLKQTIIEISTTFKQIFSAENAFLFMKRTHSKPHVLSHLPDNQPLSKQTNFHKWLNSNLSKIAKPIFYSEGELKKTAGLPGNLILIPLNPAGMEPVFILLNSIKRKGDAFIDDSFLQAIQKQIERIIEWQHLKEEERKNHLKFRLGFKIVEQIRSGLDFKGVYAELISGLPEIIEFESGSIFELAKDKIKKIDNFVNKSSFRGIEKDIQKLVLNSAKKEKIIVTRKQIRGTDNKLINYVFPITINDKFSVAFAISTEEILSEEDLETINFTCLQTGVTLGRIEHFIRQELLANIDGLTELLNHRVFQENIHSRFNEWKRYNRDFSLVMLDIDFFKRFNDQYGHQTGDDVLKIVSAAISELIRTSDLAYRYGGEEFAIILPATKIDDALIFAERLREKIEAIKIKTKDYGVLRVNISLGVSEVSKLSTDAPSVIKASDKSLYLSKESGRNMVSFYSSKENKYYQYNSKTQKKGKQK